jgi:hypothetical protein
MVVVVMVDMDPVDMAAAAPTTLLPKDTVEEEEEEEAVSLPAVGGRSSFYHHERQFCIYSTSPFGHRVGFLFCLSRFPCFFFRLVTLDYYFVIFNIFTSVSCQYLLLSPFSFFLFFSIVCLACSTVQPRIAAVQCLHHPCFKKVGFLHG